MSSTNAERQRRHRAHRSGDHDLCSPDRCDALRTSSPPAPVTLATLVASVTGSVSEALERALVEAKPATRDAGAVALARRYAALVDGAAVLAKHREPLRVLRRAVDAYDDPEAAGKAFDRIHEALAAHSVASDLGPKLLAALTALGMTVAGRGVKGGEPSGGIAARLDEFTAARARKHPA